MKHKHSTAEEALFDKIRSLSPERIAEVEYFVELLRLRDDDKLVTRAASALAEDAFAKVWNNAADDGYDRL